MGAPRKNPPPGAAATIQRLAAEGHSKVGVARHFGVVRETLSRWLEDDGMLDEAYEQGRDQRRFELEQCIYKAAVEGKNYAISNAMFLLKSRFGYRENDKPELAVDVKVSNVMVVPSLGTDEEWEARALAQQAALVNAAASPSHSLPSPTTAIVPSYGPPTLPAPQTVILDHSLISPIQPKAPAWDADEWRPKA